MLSVNGVFNDESLVVECRECQASLHHNCLRPHWQSRHEGVRFESDDEQDKNKGKRPVAHQMFTPPQGQRVSLSPKTHIVPPGLPGPPLLGGRPPSEKATADKERFMTICKARLTTLYKYLEQYYDRVHGTAKVGDLGEMSQEGLESGLDASLDEGKSTGSWESISHGNWKPRGKEDSIQEGHASQRENELIAHVPETSALSGSLAKGRADQASQSS